MPHGILLIMRVETLFFAALQLAWFLTSIASYQNVIKCMSEEINGCAMFCANTVL